MGVATPQSESQTPMRLGNVARQAMVPAPLTQSDTAMGLTPSRFVLQSYPGEPDALIVHVGFCLVCGDKALLPCVALSRRGALRVLALGPTVPRSGTCEPAVLFGRLPASTQLRARQGQPGRLE